MDSSIINTIQSVSITLLALSIIFLAKTVRNLINRISRLEKR